MTAEEKAEEAEFELQFQNIEKARAAIVAHLGGPWKRQKGGGARPDESGRVDCPVCGKPATLGFRRSGYNGHIHARCTTEGCMSWME